jgi:hypothetical protein
MMVAGSHRESGIAFKRLAITKAKRMPIPPPFGVGRLWELRKPGRSIRPQLPPIFITDQAPATPRHNDSNKYRNQFIINNVFRASSFIDHCISKEEHFIGRH